MTHDSGAKVVQSFEVTGGEASGDPLSQGRGKVQPPPATPPSASSPSASNSSFR